MLATFRVELPVLATTAAGGLACPRFGGATGDGFMGAATARAAVVGDVTEGTVGAGTAGAVAAPGAAVCASCAIGLLGAAATLVECSVGAALSRLIDDSVTADAVASSDGGGVADCEHPAIGTCGQPKNAKQNQSRRQSTQAVTSPSDVTHSLPPGVIRFPAMLALA